MEGLQPIERAEFEAALTNVVGRPAWGIRLGWGSFVFLNFGKEIRTEEREFRRGESCIWIYCCDWRLLHESRQITHSEDARASMQEGVESLNGSVLREVSLDQSRGIAEFRFSNGMTFTLTSYDDPKHERMWMLYYPENRCLAVSHPPFTIVRDDIGVGAFANAKLPSSDSSRSTK